MRTTLVALSFFLIGAIFTSFVAIAWQDPTDDPPEENVAAPVNVGSSEQLKEGILGLDGLAVFGNTLLSGTSGSNAYLNFGEIAGESGYGIRDGAGTLEFKSTGGTWQSLTTSIQNILTLNGISFDDNQVEEIEFADGTTQNSAGGGSGSWCGLAVAYGQPLDHWISIAPCDGNQIFGYDDNDDMYAACPDNATYFFYAYGDVSIYVKDAAENEYGPPYNTFMTCIKW